MKTTTLAIFLTIAFLLVWPPTILAVEDATGDNYVPQTDLRYASVQTFGKEFPDAVFAQDQPGHQNGFRFSPPGSGHLGV